MTIWNYCDGQIATSLMPRPSHTWTSRLDCNIAHQKNTSTHESVKKTLQRWLARFVFPFPLPTFVSTFPVILFPFSAFPQMLSSERHSVVLCVCVCGYNIWHRLVPRGHIQCAPNIENWIWNDGQIAPFATTSFKKGGGLNFDFREIITPHYSLPLTRFYYCIFLYHCF